MRGRPYWRPNLGEEFADEERDVLLALAKRGDEERHDVQTIEEVFAEVALGDLFFEVLVCGGDEAHIDTDGLRSADGREHLVVEGGEHFSLGLEAHVADFIEEERARVGAFEGTPLLKRTARLRAVTIAEEFGFDVIFGDGGAVEFYEDAVTTKAFGMDGASDEFLASA